jgi:hypothetical protein
MTCNEKNTSLFVVNYKKKSVKFKPALFDKKVMSLNEFALTVLGIDPISIEIIAMYIGKLGYDTYKEGKYNITILKKIRHGIKGKLEYKEN